MMELTAAKLITLGVSAKVANAYVEPLKAAFALMQIDTPAQVAAFLGQTIVESIGFTRLEEGLYYTTPERILAVFGTKRGIPDLATAKLFIKNPKGLANRVYANREGNGNEASGDGWLYRGRSLIQTTFKNNYAAAEAGCGRPYLSQPDLLLQPSDAVLASVFYFVSNGCRELADAFKIDAVTYKVNRAGLEKERRAAIFTQALPLFTKET